MLKLASGKSVPVMANCAALRDPEKTRSLGLPVLKGQIGGREVDVMRDTGCEGVVVRKQLVDTSQLTGECCLLLRIDNTALLAEKAVISLRTPLLSGEVKALCIPDAICDVNVGNVEGARSPEDPDMSVMVDCMKEVCRLLGIKQKTTTPYHPMCNKLVERFNATLKTCLRRLCSEQPRQWNRYINPLLFAYREMPQESTHFAPFELLYGRTVRGPMHILRELCTKEIEEADVKSSYEYVLNLRERLDDTLKIAREELEKAQGRQKRYYDRMAKRRKFSVGEKELVLLPTDSNKLLMQWKGPFEIVTTVGINDYRINMGGKEKTFHANLLKGYIARHQNTSQANMDERSPTSSSAMPAASVTIIEDLEGEHFNDSDCEALPELGGWGSKETVNDLKFGDELTLDQRRQLEEVALIYSSIFSDRPGTASTEEHCIELTSSIPVRQRPYPVPYATNSERWKTWGSSGRILPLTLLLW
ncbi:Zinc finger protein [Plakobranchus ocellatus]|uniref:Zinc finger protein n=1 Tax=Plakobranchus ocellatus TaxID=259542 RepID=A0AAV3ZZM4_9GAST|nr:Zinc finger protein [Plakobranchus ocellatus]